MLTIPRQVLSLPSFEVWWPDEIDNVLALLAACPLVTVHGCPDDTAASLEKYSFRRKSTFTLLFDLTLPTVDLWKGLRRKSCRQDINKALKCAPDIVVNSDTDAVFHLINDHIRRKRYRRRSAGRPILTRPVPAMPSYARSSTNYWQHIPRSRAFSKVQQSPWRGYVARSD